MLGGKRPKSFLIEAWTEFKDDLNKKYEQNLTIEQIKNRYSLLRGRYNEVKKLMSLSGFEWDPEEKKIIVDDEGVWDAYLKENPDKKKYKTIGCPNYEDLCSIFGDSNATGSNAYASAENVDVDTPLKSSRKRSSVVRVEEVSESSNEKANERKKTKRATSTAGLSEAFFAIADVTKAKYVTDLDKDPYCIPNCTKYLQSIDCVRMVEESWVLEFARCMTLIVFITTSRSLNHGNVYNALHYTVYIYTHANM
ncbi:hypothetical protein MKX01_010246 [Papaver californicum]|nr:hypothetical protein MKX01_010246 [Papaver californicum]